LAGWRAIVKSIEDMVLASLLIVALSPILAAVAAAVRLDSPGPILFRQRRFGFNNQIFHVYKFRSMYHNRPPEIGTPQATRNDPRITRVGAFIRKTSLDELPQLFNVLNGTMSLVGPRPHAVDHNELYGGVIESYFARHRMKPGITGWAQANGLRGETDAPEKMAARVRYDLEYIEKWSLWMDLKIIAKTAKIVLLQESAY
jgi:exopolysaccharide biosynthesis polyprenyl glycosylphosphotransferase